MSQIVTGMNEAFGPWLCQRLNIQWTAARGQTIALVGAKGIEAVTLFEDYNKRSVMMHVAAVGQMTREFLTMCFDYPFNQLGCHKVVGPTVESNRQAIRFIERLGFVEETRIKDAAPGGDIIIYTMTREQCKWLAGADRLLARYRKAA